MARISLAPHIMRMKIRWLFEGKARIESCVGEWLILKFSPIPENRHRGGIVIGARGGGNGIVMRANDQICSRLLKPGISATKLATVVY